MPDSIFHVRSPTFRIVLDSFVVVLLVVAVYQQQQNRSLGDKIIQAQAQIRKTQNDFIREQRHTNNRFANVLVQGCVASNSSRESLRNLLIAVQTAQRVNPRLSPQEKADSAKFFKTQIDNIKLSDCSRYKQAAQG